LTKRVASEFFHLSFQQQCDTSDELTTQEIIKLIDELYEAGIYNIAFSGGEASLRNDIFDILDECRRLNLVFQIFTNGQIPEKNSASHLLLSANGQCEYLLR
jgi:MoaA/NifB/PqqE/SkfB family radical SAM enzyme